MKLVHPKYLRTRGILGMNRRNIEYIAKYNDRENFPLVDNKLATKIIAEEEGLAVPELLHVVSAQYEIEELEKTLAPLEEFVVKPAHGSGGKGILVIEGKQDGGFRKSSGSVVSPGEVKRHLTNIISGLHSLGGRQDLAFVEELVKVDPVFRPFSHEGVPDIRLIVFKGFPIMAMLRLATRASDGKANLHQGAIGVGIDISTGNAVQAVMNNRVINAHPDSGANLSELFIPDWGELMMLAARCYEATELGYLGCDIVLDAARGPLILELNARPGLSIQIANDCGLLPRLEHLERFDTRKMVIDDRVDYAMQTFVKGEYS